MTKKLTLILSLMASPLAAMEKPTLEKFLNDKEAETHSYMRSSVCGVEIIVDKKDRMPAGYLLSCPQANKLLQTLLEAADKADYSVSYLKMTKSGNSPEEKYDISVEEAKNAIATFAGPMQSRITQFMEKCRKEHIQEYERKYGPVEKK